MKKLSKKEKMELRAKVDDEGLDYYLRHYTNDYDDFVRAGIDLKEIQAAVNLYNKIEALLETFPEFED